MKALDTGVLLALLEGSPKAREQIRKLRGVEIATTEANLLELACLAAGAPPKSRKARLDALERLRARLTVVPIDTRATQEASRRGARSGVMLSPALLAMMGALTAAGCDELLTDQPRSISGDWGLRVKSISV